MWKSMLYTSILAILMADTRTGALLNRDGGPRRCYQCPNGNTTCNQQKASIVCNAEKPVCGTIAVGPHYVSALSCMPCAKHECTVEFSVESTIQLSCLCAGDYCNLPFSKKVENKLRLFANTNTLNKSQEQIDKLIKYLDIDNVFDLYKYFTDEIEETETTLIPNEPTVSTILNLTDIPLAGNQTNNVEEPRVEALKHEATVPPDDDEDESEGSGAYDDTKTPKNPASAPAVPSAYLPAEKNKASLGLNVSLTLMSLIVYAALQKCT